MKKKRLMILGGTNNELPAVVRAKARSIETVVVDMNPNAPAFVSADRPVTAKTKDVREYIDIAAREKIDGVMTVACEAMVRKVAAVARALNLPGISEETALTATDKLRMRKIFLERGISSPRFVSAETVGEAKEKLKNLVWPLVIKPVDQAGSRGVFQLKAEDDLDRFFDMSKKISTVGRVIIEEFIDGIESTIDALTIGGRTYILGISDKKKVHSPNIIAMDLTFPPAYSTKKLEEVEILIRDMLAAVGLDHGASHTEVMVTDNGPKVIEFAARSGGGLIPSDILPNLCGFDVIDKLISMALGEDPSIPDFKISNAVDLRFFRAPSGRLKKIHGMDEALKIRGVHKVSFTVKEGDFIRQLTEDNDRAGFVIAYGRDRDEAVRIADMVEDTISFELY